MYPKLFQIGPIPVYSYGLMLGIAFLVGSTLFSKELKRYKIEESIGVTITFLAIIGGLVGSKIFYIIEEWNFGVGSKTLSSFFTADTLFSPSGLTFYGGVILSIFFIWIYCKRKNVSLMQVLDSMSPAAAVAYGIARIGCHLSGDGCYGVDVNGTFWQFIGCSYSKGIVPTDKFPGELALPTPLIETAASIIIFIVLWKMRTHIKYFGQLFYYYLIFSGAERFLIEIVRLNPRIIFGFSQAQLISLAMIVLGVVMLFIKRKNVSNIQTN